MKTDWRHKLSIEWPCAVGDWLWWAVVVAPAQFLNWLTFKRVAMIAGLLVFVYGFGQIFAIDIAIVFATDAMIYFDVLTAVTVISARQHVRRSLHAKILILKELKQKLKSGVRLFCSNVGRRRRRVGRVLAKFIGKSKDSDGDPGFVTCSPLVCA